MKDNSGAARDNSFIALIRLLIMHEAAEEHKELPIWPRKHLPPKSSEGCTTPYSGCSTSPLSKGDLSKQMQTSTRAG